MAAASLEPKRIRQLHLTGVEAERDGLANVILASWKEILGPNSTDIDDEEVEEEFDPIHYLSKCTSRLCLFVWSYIRAT